MSRVYSCKFGWVLVLAVLSTGCSVKMAYNNLDRLVRWGVSDYVDLNAAQKEVLQSELATVHEWHRRNHLPLYAAYTQRLARELPDGVTAAQLADMFEQFEVWSGEVEERFNPLVINIMVSLSDEQVAALPARLDKNNTELAEPEADKPLREVQLLWAEEFGDGLKNFTGRLSKTQRAYLERRSLEYQPERVLWADYRARFQAELLALLQRRQDKEAFASGYKSLVANREAYYGPELTAVFANNLRLNREAAAHILSNLSERQSAKFVEALEDLGEDFAELAAQT